MSHRLGTMVMALPHAHLADDDAAESDFNQFLLSSQGLEGSLPTTTQAADEGLPVGTSVNDFQGPPLCAACETPIAEQFIHRVDAHVYHADCLRCGDCAVGPLLVGQCYAWGGYLYCQKHFYRRYGVKCSGCKQGMPPTQTVRQAQGNVYHVNCFACTVCALVIEGGKDFHMTCDNALVCKQCYTAATNTATKRRSASATRKTKSPSQEEFRKEMSRQLAADFHVVQLWLDSLRGSAKNKTLMRDGSKQNAARTKH